MLFFTYKKNGWIRSVYNGRFAFLHCTGQDELESIRQLRGENNFKQLWIYRQNGLHADVAEITMHEYMHKQIFGLSKMGLILVGWRLFARLRYVVLGQRRPIMDYYRARGIYYFRTVLYHETLSKMLESADVSEGAGRLDQFEDKVKGELSGMISEADAEVTAKWRTHGVNPVFFLQPLYFAIGRWFHESFSIGITHPKGDNEEGVNLIWTADGGIPNDISGHRQSEPKRVGIFKRILSRLIVNPLNRNQTFEQVFEWFHLGQRTQFQCFSEVSGISMGTYQREYLHPILLFVMQWANLPIRQHAMVLEIAEDAIEMEEIPFMDKWKTKVAELSKGEAFHRVFGFFFLHGN